MYYRQVAMSNKQAYQNGLNALNTVRETLTRMMLQPESTNKAEVLRIDFNIDNIPISYAIADIRLDYERFLYYLVFRDRVPVYSRQQVMECITRANYDLVIGNFELNLDDGLLRFKSSIDFTNTILTETMIKNVIACAKDVVELYAYPLVEVMDGKISSLQAIKKVESTEIE